MCNLSYGILEEGIERYRKRNRTWRDRNFSRSRERWDLNMKDAAERLGLSEREFEENVIVGYDGNQSGIGGGGYDNQTAPNGACPTIVACNVTGTVTGNERVGGIFGGDGYVAQTWDNVTGSISANTFTGNVEATSGKYVGAVIGYRNSHRDIRQ